MTRLRPRLTLERLEARSLLAAEIDWVIPPPDPSQSADEQPLLTSLEIRQANGIRGAALELQYDPQKWSIDARDIQAGTVWEGRGMTVANVDAVAGTIDLFLFATRETTRPEGSLIDLAFRREAAQTAVGETPQLVVSELQINEGALPWRQRLPSEPRLPSDTDGRHSLPVTVSPQPTVSFQPTVSLQPTAVDTALTDPVVSLADPTDAAVVSGTPAALSDDSDRPSCFPEPTTRPAASPVSTPLASGESSPVYGPLPAEDRSRLPASRPATAPSGLPEALPGDHAASSDDTPASHPAPPVELPWSARANRDRQASDAAVALF